MITISIFPKFYRFAASYTAVSRNRPDKEAVAACGTFYCATSGHDGNRRPGVSVRRFSMIKMPVEVPVRRKIHKNLT